MTAVAPESAPAEGTDGHDIAEAESGRSVDTGDESSVYADPDDDEDFERRDPTQDSSFDDDLVGLILEDRYELVELVGQGGSGEVYRARELTLGKTVAIKLIRGAREPLKALQREARAMAQVHERSRSPHLVPVHSVSAHEDIAYFVMDYMKGYDLKTYLRTRCPLRQRELLPLVRQMLLGLRALHEDTAHIVHRDIKPANFFVETDRGVPHIRIFDFGISKALQALTNTVDTAPGHTSGTAIYMAPESFLGAAPHPGVDVYALGLIVHQMATGEVVHEGRLPSELAARFAGGIPLPLLHETERAAELGISEHVSRVVAQAVDFDPTKRFADAGAMYDALFRPTHGAEISPGEILGESGIRVIRKLGVGGMGAVYLAKDPRRTETSDGTREARTVVAKVVSPPKGLTNAKVLANMRARFARECSLYGRVHHPSIPAFYGKEDWDGTPFAVLEYIEGTTLSAITSETWWQDGWDWAAIRRAFLELGDALDALHAHDPHEPIVHRDVKPSNIMIRATDGRTMLLDFGIARERGVEDLTVAGSAPGTPGYQSPEQLEGQAVPASDQWAAAACLYEIVTGRKPGLAPRMGRAELREAIIAGGPIAPIATLRPDLEPSVCTPLDDVLKRALDADPAKRYPSVSDFARALPSKTAIGPPPRVASATADTAAYARPAAPPPEPTAPTGRRWPWGIALCVGILAGIVALLAWPKALVVSAVAVDAAVQRREAVAPTPPDATVPDAAPARIIVTIRTLDKGASVEGVELTVDGVSGRSPVTLDRAPNAAVDLVVIDPRYRRTHATCAQKECELMLERKRTKKRRPTIPPPAPRLLDDNTKG